METNIAIIGIFITNTEAVTKVNSLLHDFAPFIRGRMGLPYREKNLNVISVILDAPADKINTLSGKLGQIEGVSSKATQYKIK